MSVGRIVVGLGVSSLALCCILLGLWNFVIPGILTRQHEAELRPVMEHYFTVVQKAYSTLDLGELETVMAPNIAKSWRSLIGPNAKSRLYYDSTITDFRVLEYSPSRARVFAAERMTNVFRIDNKTGERTTFLDKHVGTFYTLTKIDGVWKVSVTEALR